MDRRRFYQRISGLLDPGCLAKKRVVIVGLGSGGSRVAVELGRLGVELLLVERPGERLEEHNIVRHVLGYRSLGKLKLTELARAIRNLNPSAVIHCQALDVVDEQRKLSAHLEAWRPDLIAVCTDNEQSKHALNQTALALRIPQVGAGVYDGGIGGEVYRVLPEHACYGCIAQQLQLQRYTPAEQIRPDYNHLQPAEVPSTCALNLDIQQIASLQSRMALDLLLGPGSQFIGLPPQVNLWVFANRVVPGTFARPLQGEFFHVAKKADCLDCGETPPDTEREANRILAALHISAPAPPSDGKRARAMKLRTRAARQNREGRGRAKGALPSRARPALLGTAALG